MRDKWLERVEHVASETQNGHDEPMKLIMWNGRNQDLYISLCPASHNGGPSMRFERSGGCNTKNPRLMKHLTECYDAIADNEDTTPQKKLEECYDAMEELIQGRQNEDAEAVQKAYEKMKKLVMFKSL
ncbi:MAG: Unknown protein [uncultured Sulfurovum sp.]|uniref:Uncharacterized protein n=1 Tax=uncultured Sulfurovum sp. TaxID=269237 RepID=A0A6S6SUR3_9BACT|nr:MAG: Unknown protein [uncultured Sulfurovum sp.]